MECTGKRPVSAHHTFRAIAGEAGGAKLGVGQIYLLCNFVRAVVSRELLIRPLAKIEETTLFFYYTRIMASDGTSGLCVKESISGFVT